MDEQEKLSGEFSLEDILKEFSSEDSPAASSFPEDEDILIWDGVTSRSNEASAPELHDTQRLDDISQILQEYAAEGVSQDTVKFQLPDDPDTVLTDDTVAFRLPDDLEAEVAQALQPPVPSAPPAPVVEPYSDRWEPEYEMPMGEYIPQEPIVFRPRSRLGELKRKLVAGPEKRYYDLTELGLGKLQLAIFINLLVTLFAVGVTVFHELGMLGEGRVKFMVFSQFFALLMSGLLGSYQLLEGITDLFKKRFSLNTLLVFSFLACLADGLLCLKQSRIPCCVAFSINMTMSLWSAYQKRNTEMGQMDTMRKATRLDSVAAVDNYYDGRPGFLRGEGQVEDFMDNYRAPSGPEKVLRIYALAVLGLSIAAGIAGWVMHSLSLGLRTASAALLLATPGTMFITLSRPEAILERRLHQLGTVLCGWQGVVGLSRAGYFPLSDQDLFPGGSVKLNGVKFYGSRTPDQVVAYATAVINACGGTMAPLFTQLLESRSGYHYDALGLKYYDGGVGAEVDGEAVLAGSLSLMEDLGVELPKGTQVSNAIYVAIDGQLSGVFAVAYQKSRATAHGLGTLCAYRRLSPVLIAADFMISENALRKRFGCNTRRMAFPKSDVRQELAQVQIPEGTPALALTTRDGLAASAYAVTGARALRSASIAGVTVHLMGGILGLAMLVLLAVLDAGFLLTPMNVLMYQLLWMIPGLLITEWTRSV